MNPELRLNRLRTLFTPPPPRYAFLLNLLVLGLLLLIGMKYTSNIEAFMDISTYDEGNYLQRGVNLMVWGVSHPSIGPLYSAWYYLLSLFQPDRVLLHYLNYRLLVILVPTLFFVVLRRYRVPLLPAFLLSVWLLIIDLNLTLWPKVNHFAALVLLLSFAVAANRRLLDQLAIIAFGFLAAAYARPELFGPALVLLILALIIGVSRRYPLSSLWLVIAVWVVVGLLRFGYGLPTDANRTYVAFGQHFAINWVAWNDSDLNPWNEWEPIYQETFGGTDSVVIAAAEDTMNFGRHVWTNVRLLPSILAYQYLKHPGIFLPEDKTRYEVAIFALLLAGTLIVTYKQWLPFVKSRARLHTPLFVGLGVFMAFALFQWLIIYPRPHYLLIPGISMLIIGALLVAGNPDAPDRTVWLTIPAALLLLWLVPATYTYSGPYPGNNNVRTVTFIRALPLTPAPFMDMNRIPIVEAEGGLDRYLGQPYLEVGEYEKDRGFADFLIHRDIAAVLYSPRLANDAGFKNDTEWVDFIAHPEKYGFFTMPIPDTDRILYIAHHRYAP